jgi:hypothetical protein
MLIKSVEPSEAVPVLLGMPENAGLTPSQWRAFCNRRGFVAFAAEQDGELVGCAVAESCPHRVHIHSLEGDTEACQFLLKRLVMLAGERDMTARAPSDRLDVRDMLKGLGFVRQGDGGPSPFYRWSRNEDL